MPAGPEKRKLSANEAKAEIVRLVGQGKSVKDACTITGKSRATYDYYRRTDKDFAQRVDSQKILLSRGKGELPEVEVPDFPEFSERYLHNKLFPHQLQWFDMLEGRAPRDLHPSMTYEEGRDTRLIVNTPPNHAKSTTITVNYVVWRIVKDPNIKVVIISKAQRLAEQFLLQIKERLTSPEYEDLQRDFAPPGGWKEGSASWKANQFYVGGRSAEAKDPTVQALGIRGALYGSRSDLIIVDDAVDNTNVGEFDKQIEWLLGIVNSRLAPRSGRTLVIGTRIAARDLYSELRDPNRYYGGRQPWTYLLQPAVLEYADSPADWKTLWPYSNLPADPDEFPDEYGHYRRWDGETLSAVRDDISPGLWSRIYQQEQVTEDAIFKAETVAAACQTRHPGLIPDDPRMGREGGMEGLRLIAGLDPASVGYTAAVLLGVDLRTGHRYVVDVHNEASMPPDKLKGFIRNWTERYNIKEWRVEDNAFQKFLTRDPELTTWMAARGVVFTEHTTGRNKNDPDFGVMAMSGLFEGGLIHLPNSTSSSVKALIEQLVVWQPQPPKSLKTDCVMALWFAELRALELVSRIERTSTFRTSIYTTRGDKSRRQIIDMNSNESTFASSGGATPRSWWAK